MIYELNDQLSNMLLLTFRVEANLNAIIMLSKEFDNTDLKKNLFLVFNHYTLALLDTQALLKNNYDQNEQPTLKGLKKFISKHITIDSTMENIFADINLFYRKNRINISKFRNNRDTVAHAFDVKIELERHSGVDFKTHLRLNKSVRDILQSIHEHLFGYLFENIDIDTTLYTNIYQNSLDILRS